MEEQAKLAAAVCDDDGHVHDAVEGLMRLYGEARGLSCELRHLYSAEELLAFEGTPDFLLLDIDMPGMDGIEAARALERQGKDYRIVMLTGREDRYKDAFKIGAFRFVTKPIVKEELFEAVDGVLERLAGMRKIRACLDGVEREIFQKDILYLMAEGNAVHIFTERSDYRSEQPLKQWAAQLDPGLFFACHRSYIVNLRKVLSLENGAAVLATGEKVPVARRSKKALEQELLACGAK